MDSSILEDPVSADDYGESSDNFSPVAAPKTKTKAAPKKAAPVPAKSKAAAKPTSKKLAQTTLKPKATQSKKRAKPQTDDEASEIDRNSLHDDSLLSVTPPSAKKQKKAPVPKKKGGKPLQDIENDVAGLDGSQDPQPNKGPGATERYQKLTQLEHILKRPDTYVGSIERTGRQMWVYNSTTESMELRDVSYVPGLYKIFDEILVNAADNKQADKNMDTIKVTVDREKGEISVWNNGRGIPIEIHDKERIYIPEMIFGHLLTSSNYDDNQQKVTGGRNGFGAKLCNIFSTEFTLETADSRTGKKYKQVWKENMSNMGKAKITSNKRDDFTQITFTPDFAKFGMTEIDDDFEALVKRRVYDLAGTSRGVKVVLNGNRIPIKTFKQYMEMYAKAINKESGNEGTTDVSKMLLTDQPDPRWEIGFAVSDGSFQQVSFVNSIATTSGGTHVNYISDQIVTRLMEAVKKKNKGGLALKNNQIRNHIFLFVNCLVVNPAFTSQTKEQLTTKPSAFGSNCQVSDAFLKKVAESEAVKRIIDFALVRADQVLKKSDGSRRSRMNNPKLTDANKAGTKDGWKCTLILTEGDSAKGLAIAGRSVVGPDEFGVFPLRGKLLNVRDASIDQISKNSEIQSIKQFLGLQHKKEYTDTKGLRYGHIMIMTDQDHDGSHIKGLLINFLQCTFPSLLKIPHFLIEFITPIVKVWKGDPKHPTKSKSFFTMPEYEVWVEEHKDERGWEHKYYKGLGTSSTEDAQVYFGDLDRHLKEFHTMKEEEEKLIELAFSKKKADERKEWLRQFKPGTYLDHSIDKISYDEFINKELILFSMADNMRSIPSVIDGMKPGQRKVLYTCFKRNMRKDMKVAELAGLVSGSTAYQHGEASLQQTIVGLAQTFVGSNNINVLEPSGNFGSRLQGGSDCASARYIYTRLSPFARRVFSTLDDPLLTYNIDDNKQIEPEVYCPVVPMILINGADGIGTGWSTSIPNYDPEDVVRNIRGMMKGEITVDDPIVMTPWFRGWNGEVKQIGPDRFKFSGIVKQTGDNEIEITELPIRTWTQDFKDKLEEIIKAEKIPSFIKDYTDYNTHIKVHFIIQLEEKHMKIALEEGLEEKFKLSKSIATSNLVAFNEEGRLHKYGDVKEILWEFYWYRLKLYQKRKLHQLSELQVELDRMTNQARFIQMIIDGKLVIAKKKKSDLVSELQKKGFRPFPKAKDAAKAGEIEPTLENDDETDETVDTAANAYDYLLGMAIWSLTKERVDKLLKQIGDKEEEINILNKLSPKDLWAHDIDEFITQWRSELEDDAKRQKKVANRGRRASNKLQISARGPAAKKRKAKGDDPDDSDFVTAKPKKAAAATRIKPEPKSDFFNYHKEAAKPVQDAAKSTSLPKRPTKEHSARVDGGSDSGVEEEKPRVQAPQTAKAAGGRAKPSASVENSEAQAGETTTVKVPTRRPRAAASKPIKYDSSSNSDSDNGDDLLGDVSKLVKGIGGGSGDPKPGERALFSASRSRPSSSAGLPQSKTKTATKSSHMSSDDETDFSKLAPPFAMSKGQGSVPEVTIPSDDDDESIRPTVQKSTAPSNHNGAEHTEDEDKDDSDVFLSLVTKKGPSKTAKQDSKPKAKSDAKSSTAAKTKKPPVKKVADVAPKKQALSPAAKAYAQKQAKKKAVQSDEDGEDVEAIANDLLDSPSEGGETLDQPARRGAPNRPSRRAAAAKAKPVYEDIDSESDEVGEGFSEEFSDSE
ncbi:MAG: DNA topoisomerase 2 [Sclerophora amabilis]|nr:MAG: DNA topoisomerase 2 [Sclerophora amabilis]